MLLTLVSPMPAMAIALTLGSLLMGCNQVDVVGLVAEDTGHVTPVMPNHSTISTCDQVAQVFDQALCSCGPATVTAGLATKSSDGMQTAHVKVAGALNTSGMPGTIEGDLVLASANTSVMSGDDTKVKGDLWVVGELGVDGVLSVEGDAYVAAPIFGSGSVTIKGDLQSPIADLVMASTAEVDVMGMSITKSFSVAAPCVCGAQAPDIAGWVADRSQTQNHDNAQLGFDQDSLSALSDKAEVSLPAGTLWISEVNAPGDLILVLSGDTTLLVQGDMQVGGILSANGGPDGDLAIFVAGSVALGGKPQLADAPNASHGRMYVGGPMSVDAKSSAKGQKQWVGSLYAPQLSLQLTGDTEVNGALHVGELTVLGKMHSTYDSAVADIVEDCDAH